MNADFYHWLSWWVPACTLLLLLALLHRFLARRAIQRAKDEEWLERYFATVRADRAARDRIGRFIPAHLRSKPPTSKRSHHHNF